MVNVLSSNGYILIGSKISNLNFTNAIEKKRVFNLYEVPKFFGSPSSLLSTSLRVRWGSEVLQPRLRVDSINMEGEPHLYSCQLF